MPLLAPHHRKLAPLLARHGLLPLHGDGVVLFADQIRRGYVLPGRVRHLGGHCAGRVELELADLVLRDGRGDVVVEDIDAVCCAELAVTLGEG